jgi:hypothetical protein
MDWTRTIDEILVVFTDGCDVVFKTRASRTFRILAESMIGTLAETKAYVSEKLNRRVRILHLGERCEFIFEI